jgi:putative membrane protein
MRVRALVVALLCCTSARLAAQGVEQMLMAPGALSPWDVLAVLALLVMAAGYWRGVRRLKTRGAPHRRREIAAFVGGELTLLVAILPPIDAVALERFSVHMAQHELMMLVGVPLLMAGRPLAVCMMGLPNELRPYVARMLQSDAASSTWRVLTMPVIAWALHGAATWIWHAPPLYEWAVANEAVHAIQHFLFIGTSGLFWWGLLYGRYGRVGYGASVFYVFTTTVHTGLLGALITFARAPLYASYATSASGHPVDAIGDQQIAGLLMWVPAGIVLTGTGLALFAGWLGEAQRRARPVHCDLPDA